MDDELDVDWGSMEHLGANFRLPVLRQMYLETQNPYCAWEAIRLAALAELPIPDWAELYVTKCASRLVAGEPPAEALMLNPGRGKAPLIKEFTNDIQRNAVGVAVEFRIEKLRRQHGSGVKQSAYQQIATELGVTEKQARTSYEDWIKLPRII